MPWGPSTVRAELARLEESACSSTRTPPPAACPPTAATALRRRAAGRGQPAGPAQPLELPTMRREVDEAMRATTEQLSQVTNLLALVTAPADRDGHDPARRGAAAAAAGGDGGGDHLDRRRHQARDLLRPAGRPGPRGLGRQLPQRGARRDRRGLADAPRAARGAASWARASARSSPRSRPAFTELEETRREHALHGRRRAAAAEDRFQELSQIGALMEMLEHRRALLARAAPVARRAERATCASAARTRRPSCTRSASWPPATASPGATSARCG